MALLTQAQIDQLLFNGSETERDKDHLPVVKITDLPDGLTLLLTELNPQDPVMAVGLCDNELDLPAYCDIDLRDFERIGGPPGLDIECDDSFQPTFPISVYAMAGCFGWGITEDEKLLTVASKILDYQHTKLYGRAA